LSETLGSKSGLIGGGLIAAAILTGLFAATAVVAQALQPSAEAAVVRPAQADQIAQGEALFDDNCASCHQSAGIGVEGTYPPLLGNPAAADSAFVDDVIRNGKSGELVVAGVTYNGTMSSKGDDLTDEEIAAVVAYVVDLSSQSADTTTVDVAALPVGVSSRGKQMFRGDVGLANGAAACAACHVAGSVGNLGGGSLGPDLTDVSSKLGGIPGLSGWLANPPAAVMSPVFSRHPLTEGEIADLAAFLDDAPNQTKPSYLWDDLVLGAIAGALILVIGMAFIGRGMRQTYVEKLRSRS